MLIVLEKNTVSDAKDAPRARLAKLIDGQLVDMKFHIATSNDQTAKEIAAEVEAMLAAADRTEPVKRLEIG